MEVLSTENKEYPLEDAFDYQDKFVKIIDGADEEKILPIGSVAGWVSAGLAAASFIADLMERSETRHWQDNVITLLNRIEGKIDVIVQRIAELHTHIGFELERQRIIEYGDLLLEVVESYKSDLPGMIENEEFAMRRSETLIARLKPSSYILRKKGTPLLPFVGIAMAIEHDLMHFNKTPLSTRKEVFKVYNDFFSYALSGTNNLNSVLSNSKKDSITANQELNNHKPLWANNQSVLVKTLTDSRGCDRGHVTYHVKAKVFHSRDGNSIYSPKDEVKTERVSSTCRDIIHRRDRLKNDVNVEQLDDYYLTLKESEKGACWGPLGSICSQVYGPYENWVKSNIDPWNRAHQLKINAAIKANEDFLIAEKLLNAANKFNELSKLWVVDSNSFPPK